MKEKTNETRDAPMIAPTSPNCLSLASISVPPFIFVYHHMLISNTIEENCKTDTGLAICKSAIFLCKLLSTPFRLAERGIRYVNNSL